MRVSISKLLVTILYYFFDLNLSNAFVRGPGYEELRLSQPDPNAVISPPRWLVVGGRKVVPGSIYRVVVETFRRGVKSEDHPITVRAAITHNYQQIAFGKIIIEPGDLSQVLLRIPDTSVEGRWQLRIEGYEGEGNLHIFKNITTLKFSPKFLTILIQTSRAVYNAKQTVRFRTILLTREQKPYEGPVDCYVMDPRGSIMRRWPSRQTGDGIVNLQFDLPDYPLLGNWTIQIQVRQQVQNKTIMVEQYFRPFFEVFVRLPQTFKVTDDEITGVVVANMTNWRFAYGNCSIKLEVATNSGHPIPTTYETVYQHYVNNFKGFYGFSLPMSSVAIRAGNLKDVIIRVSASVTEVTQWSTEYGWALARIVQEAAKIRFLGDQPLFFRPGMPVTVHVLASYEDNHPFESDELMYAELTVTLSSTVSMQKLFNGTELMEGGGVAKCTFYVPVDARSLEISASFLSTTGLTSGATLQGIMSHSPRNRYLQVETSTVNVIPGENIVLHVRNNFYISNFNYMVVANGQIILSGREYINDINIPSVATFALPASAEMSPVAKILVWVTDQDKEIIANSLAIFVDPLAKHKVSLKWNEAKDYTGGSVEIKFIGEKGSFFSASAVWEEAYMMDAGNDLDRTRVLLQMMDLEYSKSLEEVTEENMEEIYYGALPHIRHAYTRSRDGYGSNVRFFPSANAGPDAPTTFNFSEVVLFTDAMIYYHPSKATGSISCKTDQGNSSSFLQCLTGGCYSIVKRCDGVFDCPDASDEAGCFVNVDPYKNFRLHRINRLSRFYNEIDGDWAWQDIRRVGREIRVFPIPKMPQNWMFSFFAVGKEKGLGILEKPVQLDAAFTFVMNVDAPKVARMWEQVGLVVAVFNFHSSTVGVFITVPTSEDYQTIQVEENGVVSSYEPKSVNRTFQHLVWLEAGSSTDVHIPIVFKRLGQITVTFRGDTQIHSDSHSISINVIPEGAYIPMHTSILFDLKDRALVYEFMNINLDESPVIPYRLQRRYIYSTPQGHISVTGDVVGPAFPEIPVNENNLLGYNVMGAETSAFSFASNIWSLHYLRLTNQITDSVTYKVLTAANVYYADLCRYQSESGGFHNWIGSEESVWLTAHALKNLWIADFQDWENHIFIDPKIIRRGVNFLLNYQSDVGSFQETVHYFHPLDPKMDPRSRNPSLPNHQNVSLTAHVVITIQSLMPGLEGSLHRRANLAKQRAVSYLERVVQTLTDPYDLAIVAWALTTADSKEKNFAYSALDNKKRIYGNRVYWSRERIEFHSIIYEDSQRPYLQPKGDNRWDAHAVEATAYALLVYMKREGVGIVQENVVRFLASMRELDGGIISSLDSLIAKEALVEYSYRARIRDITDMNIFVEASARPNSSYQFSVQNEYNNLAEMKSFELENLFGHLTVVGRGSGQALLQLHYVYYIDNEEEKEVPVVPSFDVYTIARFSGKNSSQITITSCQSWVNTNESETSGLTVVEIHLPSGYYIIQKKLIEMVQTRKVRNLRWAYITDADVKFFFNKLDSEPVCFTYTLERWYPVSNHSRFGSVRTYELYQPERFDMRLFEVYPLYTLDICEVCGSYQCPYCPFYSGSTAHCPVVVIMSTCLLLMFYNQLVHASGQPLNL